MYLFQETKKRLLDDLENLTPKVLQCIRKQARDIPLEYDQIREKIGKVTVIGKQTKNRITEVLKSVTNLDDKKIDEITNFVINQLQNI